MPCLLTQTRSSEPRLTAGFSCTSPLSSPSLEALEVCFPCLLMSHPHDPKSIVARFNHEIIERGNMTLFPELVSPNFINHTAPSPAHAGPAGFQAFFADVLRAAFSDIQVEIHDQIAEGDKVVTRKTIHGTHTGLFMGVEPTDKRIHIQVTDIVRLLEGKYVEHWGSADIHGLLAHIKPA